MSSWRVRFSAAAGGYSTEVDMIDSIGPVNDWTSRTSGAFSNAKGTFTNSTHHAVDVGGDWVLDDMDIDEVRVGSSGKGKCGPGNAGDFPNSDLGWVVLAKL